MSWVHQLGQAGPTCFSAVFNSIQTPMPCCLAPPPSPLGLQQRGRQSEPLKGSNLLAFQPWSKSAREQVESPSWRKWFRNHDGLAARRDSQHINGGIVCGSWEFQSSFLSFLTYFPFFSFFLFALPLAALCNSRAAQKHVVFITGSTTALEHGGENKMEREQDTRGPVAVKWGPSLSPHLSCQHQHPQRASGTEGNRILDLGENLEYVSSNNSMYRWGNWGLKRGCTWLAKCPQPSCILHLAAVTEFS